MSALLFDTTTLIELCRENDVAKLGVFGSMARGEANHLSDIDLLVEFSKRKSLLALVSLERKMSAALGRKVVCSRKPRSAHTCVTESNVTCESFMKRDDRSNALSR
jgi:predicted nucleotidyltransferase